MNERTLRVLEYNKIKAMLIAQAMTENGKILCDSLLPMTDLKEIIVAQEETEEAVVVITYIGSNPLVSFGSIQSYVSLANKGATLSPKALLMIAQTLRASKNARNVLVTDRENTPRLTQLASNLQTFRSLEQDITGAILSEEELADSASPTLFDIRRHLRIANDKVREKLYSMVHGSQFSKYMQESIITVRNGRHVIPVKAEHKGSVPGLVHDQSATGATLFIEPLAVVELTNQVREWQVKEQAEIERILAAFSSMVADNSELILNNVSILTHIDFVFAKACLSREMNAIVPKLNDKGIIKLVRVRHPLLNPSTVVPCDLWLGEDFTGLIVTGPNTGGKTVTLKTVGLLTLMAQSGLQVPGALGTELAVFDQVFADIGDEQSIEQSLSTFSSHMTNIVSILENVSNNDLVLFDELGAGTDPTEGAALAQVILEYLRERGIATVATTHYSELKAYALTTPRIENASAEFDVQTLRPTYRLSIGVPGKSNAFEISKRLGLPETFIHSAKELLSHETLRFEDVIANAEYHKQVAEKERKLAEEAKQETVRLRNEAEKLFEDMEERERNATRKAKDEARRILETARREADSIIAELKQLRKNAAVPGHDVSSLKKRLEDNIDSTAVGIQIRRKNQNSQNHPLRKGDIVKILTIDSQGTILGEKDAKGEFLVQAGIMKMKVHESKLELIEQEKPKKSPKSKSSVTLRHNSAGKTTSLSCDVRGHALDEALPVVDSYLDEAVLSGYREVTIVHGKGTGILRSGITQHLRRHQHVKSHRLGQYGEGEDGVTIVTLK